MGIAVIVGVFGPGYLHGHEYKDYNFIADGLDEYKSITKIYTGGGVGVEQLAARYGKENGVEVEVIPPNIKAHKENAFVYRNQEIIDLVELVILFWDGNDKFYYKLISDTSFKKK